MSIEDFESNDLVRILKADVNDFIVGVNICFKKDPLHDWNQGDPVQAVYQIHSEIQKCYRGKPTCTGVDVRFIKEENNSSLTQFKLPPYPSQGFDKQEPNGNLFEVGVEPYPKDNLDSTDLPLVVFYLGNGEMLATTPFQANAYLQMSFFLREKRAAYIFLNGWPSAALNFLHELGHVLGLSDRYVNAVDDNNPSGTEAGLFIQLPRRRTVPLSKDHIEFVLHHVEGFILDENDTEYDPQLNLMSSSACRLTNFQREVIRQTKIEPQYENGHVLLLKGNTDALRDLQPQAGDCNLIETRYLPSFPDGENVMFESPLGTQKHNTFRSDRTKDPETLYLLNGFKLDGTNKVNRNEWDQFMGKWRDCDGPTLQTLKMLEDAIK